MKVAFLDRDGTIIKDYKDEKWGEIESPEFLDGSIEAMKSLNNLGYQIIFITNQYLIQEQYITFKQFLQFQMKINNILDDHGVKILDLFYCPHRRDSNCVCCKPRSGMIDAVLNKYPEINIKESLMCGDSIVDVVLGNNIQLKTFGINVNERAYNYINVKALQDILNYL